MNALIDQWKLKIDVNGSTNLSNIVDHLAGNPFITINRVSKQFNVAYTTAKRAVDKLEFLGIIQQVNLAKREKFFCAMDLLNILEEPPKLRTENYP